MAGSSGVPELGVFGGVEGAAAAGQGLACFGGAAVVDGAEGRGGEGGEDAGVVRTVSGTFLPPESPALMRW